MTTNDGDTPIRRDDVSIEDIFRPSGQLLAATTALGRAIEVLVVTKTGHSAIVLDLLIRLRFAPGGRLRGVDLCRQLLKSPGYVSRVIDQAERQGLVSRSPDPSDRRAQLVDITPAGEAALDTFIPGAVDVLDQTIYRMLGETEIAALVDMLKRITDSAHQLLESGGVRSA